RPRARPPGVTGASWRLAIVERPDGSKASRKVTTRGRQPRACLAVPQAGEALLEIAAHGRIDGKADGDGKGLVRLLAAAGERAKVPPRRPVGLVARHPPVGRERGHGREGG